MEDSNKKYQAAYEEFIKDLKQQASIKEEALNVAAQASAEELKIKRAMEAIKPFITNFKEIPNIVTVQSNGTPFKWKSTILELFKNNPSKKFTSPEILDLIYPGAAELSQEDRRGRMINLSVALSDIAKDSKIIIQKNEGGRGYIYSLNEIKEDDVISRLISENNAINERELKF
ncbi:hypothetical protein [Aurantibacillus circumpalustris]|uniref:hypothetical protein n=1 Tax=Aurantibacillus circumpalustris TaxID=3036359 RepID=UPI00295B2298|nr:hypothetical protein [Aurantibacillus circumpalustris]